MFSEAVVVHWGKLLDGSPELGPVNAQVDWDWRYLLMRRHSAAHLLDYSLAQVVGHDAVTLDSWLGDSLLCRIQRRPSLTRSVRPNRESRKRDRDVRRGDSSPTGRRRRGPL